MRLEGRIWKSKQFWLVEVPALDIITQGTSHADALAMIADAAECMAETPGFKAHAVATRRGRFELGSNSVATLTAIMLRRQRAASRLTLKQVAQRLNQSSSNAYARYEQGKTVPTIDKLEELLRAIQPASSGFVVRL